MVSQLILGLGFGDLGTLQQFIKQKLLVLDLHLWHCAVSHWLFKTGT